MGTPDEAIADLLAQVHSETRGSTKAAQANALLRVLSSLTITPGDPAWTDGRDVIGRTYEFAIDGRERRRLGQYFTPMGVGGAMASWLLQASPSTVLDPGCGSGSLLMAVAKKISTTKSDSPSKRIKLHGLDLDSRLIEMAAITARIRQVRHLTLERADFLLEKVRVVPDAVICNPPYTRHQALSQVQKRNIYSAFQDRCDIDFSKLSSLHVLFLVRALEVSSRSARLAFLTPANWLDMSYAIPIREYLLRHAHVHTVINFPTTEMVFDHATTTAAITFIEKGADSQKPTRILHAKSSREADIQAAMRDASESVTLNLGTNRRWSRPPTKQHLGPRLDEVARIRRGVATGNNSFFVLSENQRKQLSISRSHVKPCLPSPRYIDMQTIRADTLASLDDDLPRWLLTPRLPIPGGVRKYLASGAGECKKRVLVQLRMKAGREWYQVEADLDAPIVMTYFNKSGPRFVHNQARAVPLNNWLILQPRKGVTISSLLSALRRPSVIESLKTQARVYGDGLWKLEPGDLSEYRLPRGSIELKS